MGIPQSGPRRMGHIVTGNQLFVVILCERGPGPFRVMADPQASTSWAVTCWLPYREAASELLASFSYAPLDYLVRRRGLRFC
jgi:hypothetical protein